MCGVCVVYVGARGVCCCVLCVCCVCGVVCVVCAVSVDV